MSKFKIGDSDRARYKGKCARTGQEIKPGETIVFGHLGWEREASIKGLEAMPETPIFLSTGSGYGDGYHIGQLFTERRGEKRTLLVLAASSRYIREDGMSFGVGEDSGYIYEAACRLATDAEITANKAQQRAEWLEDLAGDSRTRTLFLERLSKKGQMLWQGYTHFAEDGDWPDKPAEGWGFAGSSGSNYYMLREEERLLIHTENTYDTVMSWYYAVPLAEVDMEALTAVENAIAERKAGR